MIVVSNRLYELVVNHKEGWKPEAFRERYSELLDRYDFIVGDWGYNQLRLRGFYKEDHPKAPKESVISTLQDYLFEYCNFGCSYFILEKKGTRNADDPTQSVFDSEDVLHVQPSDDSQAKVNDYEQFPMRHRAEQNHPYKHMSKIPVPYVPGSASGNGSTAGSGYGSNEPRNGQSNGGRVRGDLRERGNGTHNTGTHTPSSPSGNASSNSHSGGYRKGGTKPHSGDSRQRERVSHEQREREHRSGRGNERNSPSSNGANTNTSASSSSTKSYARQHPVSTGGKTRHDRERNRHSDRIERGDRQHAAPMQQHQPGQRDRLEQPFDRQRGGLHTDDSFSSQQQQQQQSGSKRPFSKSRGRGGRDANRPQRDRDRRHRSTHATIDPEST